MSQGIVKKEGDWIRLWVNTSLGNMSAKTITLPEHGKISRYGVLVIFSAMYPNTIGFWEADPGHTAYCWSQNNSRSAAYMKIYHRRFSFTDGNCVVSDIYSHTANANSYTANSSSERNVLLPVEIWGILKEEEE